MGGKGNHMWQFAMLVALREMNSQEDLCYNASFFNGIRFI